jgi:hypothetical protein
MRYTISITPEGSINWIGKAMPIKPRPPLTPHLSENENPDYYQGILQYEELLKQAKAESIPFEDQEIVRAVMESTGKSIFLFDAFHVIELDADIQKIQNPCDCEGGICSCKNPVVARIIPKKAEEASDKILQEIVRAWESLPGNRSYSPAEVGNWLANKMHPAISKARKYLSGEKKA